MKVSFILFINCLTLEGDDLNIRPNTKFHECMVLYIYLELLNTTATVLYYRY